MDTRNVVDSQPQQKTDRGFALAAVISSIPNMLWVSLLFIIGGLLIIALWLNRSDVNGFLQLILLWTSRVFIGVGIILLAIALYRCYLVYHNVMMDLYERRNARAVSQRTQLLVDKQRLQNKQLQVKIELEAQLPIIMKYAMEMGHNISYDGRGLKVENYLSNIHNISERGMIAGPVAAAQDFLPEPYKFSDVLQNWQPSRDGILLAKKQELITTPVGEGLCHTTFTGNTDAGKTNNERALLIQLLALEQIVYLCDRNYQRFRIDRKLSCFYDYAPIAALLAHEPIDKANQALALLKYLYAELEDRRARRKHNLVQFPDIYLVMDELPAFCADSPDIMAYVGRFLRESRQYGIFFIGAAQDLLNNTLNNDNGAIRDNLLTNFYGGGDATTGRMVLNLQKGEVIDENGLGIKGVTYLRAKGAGIEHVKARAALSDEYATQLLLGDRKPVREYSVIPHGCYQTTEQRATRAQPETETIPTPIRHEAPRRATLSDAIEVWNEHGEMGRPRLQKLLQERGLECSDHLANILLQNVKLKLSEVQ